jgi:ribosome-binding factor A
MERIIVLAGNRSQRVGDLILREISYLLLRKVKDPRIKGATITEVQMTKKAAQEGFESAKGFIRKDVGEKLNLRYVPDIRFKYDNSLEYGQEIDSLLNKITPN